jgi:hypothetical protein
MNRAKELKLFTMCMKKFIRKIFQHMVASQFETWRDVAIHDQDGMVYPLYNYSIPASDTAKRALFEGYGLEIDGQVLLADLSVSGILEEENAIGLEFYLYESLSITPYVCENFAYIADSRPDLAHFNNVDHNQFEVLYDELKNNGIFEPVYAELNTTILLIELIEKERLEETRNAILAAIETTLDHAPHLSSLNTITDKYVKQMEFLFEHEDREFRILILRTRDKSGGAKFSSCLIAPEYKSIVQFGELDSLYEKIIKVLRAKGVFPAETTLLEALKQAHPGACS